MSGLHIQVAKVPLLPSAVFISSGTGHTPNILAVRDGWLGIPLGDRFPTLWSQSRAWDPTNLVASAWSFFGVRPG